MAGTFAHLTAVSLASTAEDLETIQDFPREAIIALGKKFQYCELGCVSPDYPYLTILSSEAGKWADLMHYGQIGIMINKGLDIIKELQQSEEKDVAVSWILGFIAHVVTDTTIHPVVQRKVGDYEQNKTAHRVCEMNQDSFIYPRQGLGEIGPSEQFDASVRACSSLENANELNPIIVKIWSDMLSAAENKEFQTNPPLFNDWHKNFIFIMDNISEEGAKFLPLSRHMATKEAIIYPSYDEIDMQFIENLKTPNGFAHYNEIFDLAVANIKKYWTVAAKGIYENNAEYKNAFGKWNLDTGLDENNKLIMWEDTIA